MAENIQIENGNFETGDLTGWTCTASSGRGVNTSDAYEGYKFYFYNTTGKLYQKLTELKNGTYTVSAMFKQQTGTPTKANFYTNENVVSVIGLPSYTKKTIIVEVTDGILEFGIDFSGNYANVQADNFEVTAVFSSTEKYLIRSEASLYTIADGTLITLENAELTAQLFLDYGTDSIPDGSLLVDLVDPEVMNWTDGEEAPTLTATLTATPIPQIIITNKIDLSESTITGVEYISTEYEGNPLYACSFDGGVTWEAHNGMEWIEITSETGGMSAEALTSIGVDQWTEVITGLESFVMRFTLSEAEDRVTNIVVHYTN